MNMRPRTKPKRIVKWTAARLTREVESAMAELDERISAIAEEFRQERVIPACRRLGGKFLSGMGTYCFYDRNDLPIDVEDAAKYSLERIYAALDIEVYYGQYFGYWVRDVRDVKEG